MAEGRLTTHVLDTAHGRPAAGLTVDLYRIEDDEHLHIARMETDDDGRTGPILEGDAFRQGTYELVFLAGDYLVEAGLGMDAPRFLGEVPIRFTMDTDDHYHVPLLLSPYGYSTYRGS